MTKLLWTAIIFNAIVMLVAGNYAALGNIIVAGILLGLK